MKISKIAQLCKKRQTVAMFATEAGLWVGDGSSMYLLPEFCDISADGLALAFGISAQNEKIRFYRLEDMEKSYDLHDITDRGESICEPIDLGLWIGAIERIANSGVSKIGAVHRGFNSFAKSAYRNNPYWSIPIELRHKMPGIPVLCDPSHIAGDRNLVETISLQAANLGFDGLFVESHINPDVALSDSFQQITPSFLGKIIYRIKEMNEIAEGDADMMSYRSEIDSIDDQIAGLLSRRMKISEEIGHYKKSHSIPVVQHERYASVLDKWVERGQAAGLDPVFMKELMRCIHEESVKVQMKIIENK